MSRRQWVASGAIVGGAVVALLAVGTLAGSPSGAPDPAPADASAPAQVVRDDASARIATAQQALKDHPQDYRAWAALGVDYVQQAKTTVDPSYYAKAEGAITRSLQINTKDNDVGWAGRSALDNGKHDFRAAEVAARRAVAINSYGYLNYAALGDALTQLGQYDAAAAAIDRMNQLQPGVPAFTRASYTFELRGDVKSATAAMQRSLTDSVAPADVGFSQYYLGELAFNYGGDLTKAMDHFGAGLAATPSDSTLRAGRARVLAAQGQTQQALAEYRAVVAAVPQPQYVLELGELEQSLGDSKGAARELSLVTTEERLFEAAGVAQDVEPTLFEADHGTPAAALRRCAAGWKVRPFVEMADACAWAYHAAGRDREALTWSARSFTSGWDVALFRFHRGMIEQALGQKAAARTDLTRALAINPHFNVLQAPEAKKALTALA